MTHNVLIYTTQTCPYCIRAKQLLEKKKIAYNELSVDDDPALRQAMSEKAGRTSVPQIWVGSTHVGGCDNLFEADRNGELRRLIES